MIRAAVYVPNYENLSLSKAVIDGSSRIDANHTADIEEVERLLRDHDCHILTIFSPRTMADVGRILEVLTPYLLRWRIPVSVIGTAPTLDQIKRMRTAAITDYSVLPLGPNAIAWRLTRAVMDNPDGQGWMTVPSWGAGVSENLSERRKHLFSSNPFAPGAGAALAPA
ncbi:MAG: hypothetical protein KI792_12395 [Alphaproteobacteria bacterium]|nr:hypothetical protein [Alphaproteobacteria bacterium SS10]